MEKKIYDQKLENFCGLEYLTLEDCPMYDDPEHGPIVDITAAQEIKMAAPLIIRHMVPIRGKEVAILRHALGMSLEEFARAFKISSGAVFKWERAKDQRLSIPNEMIVRLFCSEKLKCQIPTDYSHLIDVKEPAKSIIFKSAS